MKGKNKGAKVWKCMVYCDMTDFNNVKSVFYRKNKPRQENTDGAMKYGNL